MTLPRGKIQFVNLVAQFPRSWEGRVPLVLVVLSLRHKNFLTNHSLCGVPTTGGFKQQGCCWNWLV